MDRLTAAKVFINVASTESFTATAERLEMSRPMVTRCIEAMENWQNSHSHKRVFWFCATYARAQGIPG